MREEIAALSASEYLQAARNRIVNAAAMASAYDSWSDEFSRKDIRRAWADSSHQPWERRVSLDEIRAISAEKLSDLGFGRWDETLRVIPLWAWNYIEDGCTLTSISGDEKIKGVDDIDLDVRFGCIAWGFADRVSN